MIFLGFVTGEMAKNRQVVVWQAFANLIDEGNLEFEIITEVHDKSCTFIGKGKFLHHRPRNEFYLKMPWRNMSILNSKQKPLYKSPPFI